MEFRIDSNDPHRYLTSWWHLQHILQTCLAWQGVPFHNDKLYASFLGRTLHQIEVEGILQPSCRISCKQCKGTSRASFLRRMARISLFCCQDQVGMELLSVTVSSAEIHIAYVGIEGLGQWGTQCGSSGFRTVPSPGVPLKLSCLPATTTDRYTRPESSPPFPVIGS